MLSYNQHKVRLKDAFNYNTCAAYATRRFPLALNSESMYDSRLSQGSVMEELCLELRVETRI